MNAFPAEKQALRRWLSDVERAATTTTILGMRGTAPALVVRAAEAFLAARRRLAATTTGAYLEARFRDPRLRGILGARWADYGLPPAQSAFLPHAVITAHYLDGAFYPVGSAARIAETAACVVSSAGGEVRVRTEVERILVRDGRARGVRLASGEEILAQAAPCRALLVVRRRQGAAGVHLAARQGLPFRGVREGEAGHRGRARRSDVRVEPRPEAAHHRAVAPARA
jgi:phytoene dehydrogenase-like protein